MKLVIDAPKEKVYCNDVRIEGVLEFSSSERHRRKRQVYVGLVDCYSLLSAASEYSLTVMAYACILVQGCVQSIASCLDLESAGIQRRIVA